MGRLEAIMLADAILDYLALELERSGSVEEFKQRLERLRACVKEEKCERLREYLLILD